MQKGETFKVLDHGFLKYVDSMGSDEFIVEAARQSTGRGFEGWEPSELCKYCRRAWREGSSSVHCMENPSRPSANEPGPHEWIKVPGDASMLEFMWANRHTSPFEFGELVVQVQAPIMVFREWHRHRTQTYSEMSARYIQMPDLHYLPDPERIKRQSKTNKQGSAESVSSADAENILRSFRIEQSKVYENYSGLVYDGVAKEIARLNTPVSRYSRMMAKGSLLNWLKFLSLRWDDNAQYEIQQYAECVAKVIEAIWPRTFALFLEHTKHAVTFSRSEMAVLRELVIDREEAKRVVEKLGTKRAERLLKKLG